MYHKVRKDEKYDSMIEYKNGIHISGTNLWLDSRDPQDMCFISHAHIDHLGSHSTIITSRPTAQFYEQRMRRTNTIVLDYNQPYTLEKMEIELFPAGHMLGSAQILIKKDSTRIIYSGDIKLKKGLTAEEIEFKKADILIMEATYGNPKYLFPDRMVVINQLCDEIDEILHAGSVPVLVAYSLGKGQEISKILGDKGYTLVLHNTIFDLLQTYETNGISFLNYEKYTSATMLAEKVVIVPPYVITSNKIKNIQRKKTILLSGWACDTDKIKDPVDRVFPLSDHADFNELLEYVRQVNPKRIYVTHGDPHFVDYLSRIGYEASFLGS
ncbi:MAG: MBL fold metallo-hydrolase [Candidatus Omnitrophica bacterium]|nr:MBL fold metallo-hydrolase [Candidatus Omnitrophota bacterium]